MRFSFPTISLCFFFSPFLSSSLLNSVGHQVDLQYLSGALHCVQVCGVTKRLTDLSTESFVGRELNADIFTR